MFYEVNKTFCNVHYPCDHQPRLWHQINTSSLRRGHLPVNNICIRCAANRDGENVENVNILTSSPIHSKSDLSPTGDHPPWHGRGTCESPHPPPPIAGDTFPALDDHHLILSCPTPYPTSIVSEKSSGCTSRRHVIASHPVLGQLNSFKCMRSTLLVLQLLSKRLATSLGGLPNSGVYHKNCSICSMRAHKILRKIMLEFSRELFPVSCSLRDGEYHSSSRPLTLFHYQKSMANHSCIHLGRLQLSQFILNRILDINIQWNFLWYLHF